eukprot:scaffold69367_cov90-Cyclotella_meneghiniana.AAC.7
MGANKRSSQGNSTARLTLQCTKGENGKLYGKNKKCTHSCQSTPKGSLGDFTYRLSSIGNWAKELTDGSQCDQTATVASRAKAFTLHTSNCDEKKIFTHVPGDSAVSKGGQRVERPRQHLPMTQRK